MMVERGPAAVPAASLAIRGLPWRSQDLYAKRRFGKTAIRHLHDMPKKEAVGLNKGAAIKTRAGVSRSA
jgi:hypothetical protein